jgi:hypothetical protein
MPAQGRMSDKDIENMMRNFQSKRKADASSRGTFFWDGAADTWFRPHPATMAFSSASFGARSALAYLKSNTRAEPSTSKHS